MTVKPVTRPRPANRNVSDLRKARTMILDALEFVDSVIDREHQQHASTGRTDKSVAASRRKRKPAAKKQ